MISRLPPGYLRREGEIARGVREGDSAAVVAGMRELGYLPGDAGRVGQRALPRLYAGGLLVAAERRAAAALARRTCGAAPTCSGNPRSALRSRRMTLPPEALLLRRMEGLLFQTASLLRASAPWGDLLGELIEGAEPVGELGAEHAAWLAGASGGRARAA